MSREIIDQIVFTGRVLHELRLVSSHGGNISIRDGENIYITKTGRMVGFLKSDDIIMLPVDRKTELDKEASIELIVHRQIYMENPHIKAIVHAHPIFATTLGYFVERFDPIDIEGQLFIKTVPVVVVNKPSASEELAKALAKVFKDHNTAIVRYHGTFSTGKTINEALKYTSTLENSAHIYYRFREWKA